jgi:hypothetical protein
MKKTLNAEAITNELRSASVFFPSKKSSEDAGKQPITPPSTDIDFQRRSPEQVNTRTGERPNPRTPEQVNTRTPEYMNRRTPERPIVRKSYNVFEDQHSALVRRELEGQIQGKPTSISDMVRTAIDDFLKKSS